MACRGSLPAIVRGLMRATAKWVRSGKAGFEMSSFSNG